MDSIRRVLCVGAVLLVAGLSLAIADGEAVTAQQAQQMIDKVDVRTAELEAQRADVPEKKVARFDEYLEEAADELGSARIKFDSRAYSGARESALDAWNKLTKASGLATGPGGAE